MNYYNPYHFSCIYIIYSPLGDLKYYGSTYMGLHSRFMKHITSYVNKNDYCSSFDIFDKYGVINCSIQLVLNVKCENKLELHKIERDYITSNVCVNRNIPSCIIYNTADTQQENRHLYYVSNIDTYKKKYEDTKNDRAVMINCICGKTHRTDGTLRHKKTNFHKRFIAHNPNMI
jgi:hypothetical protein